MRPIVVKTSCKSYEHSCLSKFWQTEVEKDNKRKGENQAVRRQEKMGEVLCGNAFKPNCRCCPEETGGSSQQDTVQPNRTECVLKLREPSRKPQRMDLMQPQWFQTLPVQKDGRRRQRRLSDPSQELDFAARFQWQRRGLPFGNIASYLNLEKLSGSSHSTVYKGISRIYGQLVALKVISLNTEEGVPCTTIREASLLKSLKHANIVLLHDIIQTKETLTLVFEYLHTDLAQYMSQHPGGLHLHNVKENGVVMGPHHAKILADFQLFMFQLLRALAFIHKHRILHRDLKPRNLLLSCLGELKLADFGLARAKSLPSQTYSAEVVTLGYRPPDVLLGATDYSSDVDIWGAGCIFAEMLQGQPLFPGVCNTFEQLEKIWVVLGVPAEETWPVVSKLHRYQPDQRGYLPESTSQVQHLIQRKTACLCHPILKLRLGREPEAEDLATRMLKLCPRDRISAQEACLHHFFNSLSSQLHQLSDAQSIFTVPGVKLKPEMCDLFAPYEKGHHKISSSKFW